MTEADFDQGWLDESASRENAERQTLKESETAKKITYWGSNTA
jgi:hypothetical protein